MDRINRINRMTQSVPHHLTHPIHPVNPVILSILFIAFGHIIGNLHFSKPDTVNLPPDKTDRINRMPRSGSLSIVHCPQEALPDTEHDKTPINTN